VHGQDKNLRILRRPRIDALAAEALEALADFLGLALARKGAGRDTEPLPHACASFFASRLIAGIRRSYGSSLDALVQVQGRGLKPKEQLSLIRENFVTVRAPAPSNATALCFSSSFGARMSRQVSSAPKDRRGRSTGGGLPQFLWRSPHQRIGGPASGPRNSSLLVTTWTQIRERKLR